MLTAREILPSLKKAVKFHREGEGKTERSIRLFSKQYLRAEKAHKNGNMLDSEWQQVQDYALGVGTLFYACISLIGRGHSPKWLSKHLVSVEFLDRILNLEIGVKCRAHIQKVLKKDKDALADLNKCKYASDLAIYGLPYPVSGVSFLNVEDLDISNYHNVISIMASGVVVPFNRPVIPHRISGYELEDPNVVLEDRDGEIVDVAHMKITKLGKFGAIPVDNFLRKIGSARIYEFLAKEKNP